MNSRSHLGVRTFRLAAGSESLRDGEPGYLIPENRILRSHLSARLRLTAYGQIIGTGFPSKCLRLLLGSLETSELRTLRDVTRQAD
jgi:hypothetical protein